MITSYLELGSLFASLQSAGAAGLAAATTAGVGAGAGAAGVGTAVAAGGGYMTSGAAAFSGRI